MEKTILGPAMGELDDGTDPAMSVGVAMERASGTEVSISGLLSSTGDVTEQTRETLAVFEEIVVEDLGGDVADVTMLRFYVREEHLTPDVRRQIHEVRREFFEYPDYPAATMVGVSELTVEDAIFEVEAEAFVPNEEWDRTVITPDE